MSALRLYHVRLGVRNASAPWGDQHAERLQGSGPMNNRTREARANHAGHASSPPPRLRIPEHAPPRLRHCTPTIRLAQKTAHRLQMPAGASAEQADIEQHHADNHAAEFAVAGVLRGNKVLEVPSGRVCVDGQRL